MLVAGWGRRIVMHVVAVVVIILVVAGMQFSLWWQWCWW